MVVLPPIIRKSALSCVEGLTNQVSSFRIHRNIILVIGRIAMDTERSLGHINESSITPMRNGSTPPPRDIRVPFLLTRDTVSHTTQIFIRLTSSFV